MLSENISSINVDANKSYFGKIVTGIARWFEYPKRQLNKWVYVSRGTGVSVPNKTNPSM